jgi:salicylate hydroxylase
MPKGQDIIVMGGGIAGYAMAFALAQSGKTLTIIAPKTETEAKGGIQLAPNGWAALKTLGLDDAARRTAVPLAMMRLLSAETGNTLVQIDLSPAHRRPYTSLVRQNLIKILNEAVDATGKVTRHEGKVQNISSDADNVTVTLSDGTSLTAPYLIGADGVTGLARRYVKAEDDKTQPVVPRRAFRTEIPLKDLPPYFGAQATSVWLGDGGHMVFYPLASELLNVVVVTTSGTSARRQAMALVKAQPILAPLIPYIEIAPDSPLHRFAPLDVLRRGRVILAGDAAHPMPPHLAQGAGQSLIDAACFKEALADHDGEDLNSFLTTWTASRLKATKQVQMKAERAGRLFAVDGPLTKIRNFGLATLGGIPMERQLDKIWQG